MGSKVIVIDSGLDITNQQLHNRVIGGISFCYSEESGEVRENKNYNDENGHGTSCASLICNEIEDTDLYIIKILDKYARTNSAALIEALRFTADIDIRLICLSLSTLDKEYENELSAICKSLSDRGKLIVSSMHNRSMDSLPAIFDTVIGVRGSCMENSSDAFWYNRRYPIQCVADSTPVLTPMYEDEYWMFGGNSKANAVFTGIVLEILKHNPDIGLNELQGMLESKAMRREWQEADICASLEMISSNAKDEIPHNPEGIAMMERILMDTLNLPDHQRQLLHKYRLYDPKIGVNKINAFNIVKNIESVFNISIDYKKVTINSFESINSLLRLIQRGN